MIRVVDVTHHYGIRPVLVNINMEIRTGEVVVVVGPNGMGKTTLLGVLAGVLWPHKGYVEIDGVKRRESVAGERELRRRIAYLPDQAWLPIMQTGREYMIAVGRLYGIDELRLFEHTDRLLQLFDLGAKGDQPIYSYSAGQRKKISLCAALATESPYLLLDEPFSGGLDPAGILALKRVLERLAERDDVTIVFTTPVPELVEELADRIAIVRNGELAAFDTAEGLRQKVSMPGSLAEALEALLHQDTLQNIERYFAVTPEGGHGR
jgi:ABC-type multidrug transport system ATPase subunit